MQLSDLVAYADRLLAVETFSDYCPNGLQVEGRPDVQTLIGGVTACQALLDAAVERGADAVLVHHGWFWRGEDGRVTGFRKARMQALLAHDINLIAYHLPLDAHAEFGNNTQLAKCLGWTIDRRFGEQDIAALGRVSTPVTLAELAQQISGKLQREPLLIGDKTKEVSRVAWCSGGAQGMFEEAIAQGVDVFLSGEISEQTVHLARETGVAYIAAGHHVTERPGVRALAAHLAERFGLACEFVEIDNPV